MKMYKANVFHHILKIKSKFPLYFLIEIIYYQL